MNQQYCGTLTPLQFGTITWVTLCPDWSISPRRLTVWPQPMLAGASIVSITVGDVEMLASPEGVPVELFYPQTLGQFLHWPVIGPKSQVVLGVAYPQRSDADHQLALGLVSRFAWVRKFVGWLRFRVLGQRSSPPWFGAVVPRRGGDGRRRGDRVRGARQGARSRTRDAGASVQSSARARARCLHLGTPGDSA